MATAVLEIESGNVSAVLHVPYTWQPYHPQTHDSPAWGGFAEYEDPQVQVAKAGGVVVRRPPDLTPFDPNAGLWHLLDASCTALAEELMGDGVWKDVCEEHAAEVGDVVSVRRPA